MRNLKILLNNHSYERTNSDLIRLVRKMTDFIENHAVKMNHSGFMDAVNELEHLVESNASENELQKHIETHPYILSQQFAHCHHIFPKVALGVQYETDFLCLDIPSSGKEWIAVELESTQKKVITKNGRKTAALEHAIQQIRDWRSWITNNLSYARQGRDQNGLGLIDITPRFFGYVFIGRRKNFNDKFNELRRQLIRDELITIRSWDGMLEWARKRARVFSGISDAFKLIKMQEEIIKKKDEYYGLKTIVTEIKHSEKLIKQSKQSLKILKKQYKIELSKLEAELPETLVDKILKLLKANITLPNIIEKTRSIIPPNISEKVLEDYISLVMAENQKKTDCS